MFSFTDKQRQAIRHISDWEQQRTALFRQACSANPEVREQALDKIASIDLFVDAFSLVLSPQQF
jgi:hypothetical protein